MGRNSVEAYGAKGRKDALPFDPEHITLVTDDTHPLYDERVRLEPDRTMIESVKTFGVLEPIIVRKNGERNGRPVIECIAGRQRVKAARAANKELRAEGKPPVDVYAIIRRGEDLALAEVAVVENEARRADDPLTRARKMQHLLDLGRDEKRLALVFCCSVQTVKNTLQLLELDNSVQKAIERGTLRPALAVGLTKLPREEQKAKLEELIAAGATKGEAGREAVRQIRSGGSPSNGHEPRPRVRPRLFLERLSAELRKAKQTDAAALVDFILGSDTALQRAGYLREAAAEAGWKRKTDDGDSA